MIDEVDIQQKRYQSFQRIIQTAGGAALTGAVPEPTLEIAKQLGISIADAWLCLAIYRDYFDKELSQQDLLKMVQTTGAIILGGGLAGYLGIRLAQALLGEVLETIPIANALVTAVAFGGSTFVIGVAWLAIVEQNYLLHHSQDG